MKFIVTLIMMLSAMSMSAQTYTVRKTNDVEKLAVNDSIARSSIFEAGRFLQNSAKCKYVAWACGAVSTVSMSVYLAQPKEERKSALIAVSAITGLAAFVTEIFSIQFKMSAGRELKVGAGELIYRF